MSIPDFEEFKSPNANAEYSRAFRKPVRLLKQKHSETEAKSNHAQNLNTGNEFTMTNKKSDTLVESKLKDIEYSVKQENLASESQIELALNVLSNVPYQSNHPLRKLSKFLT